MINWRNGKGGFIGGLKTAIRGFFQYAHSITSEAVAPTLGPGAGYSTTMSNDGLGFGTNLSNDGLGEIGSMTNDGIGLSSTMGNNGIGGTGDI